MSKTTDWAPVPAVCIVEGCASPGFTRERCVAHYAQLKRAKGKHRPHHEHDCEACIYLGSRHMWMGEDEPNIWHDFYFCPGDHNNLIIRYGDMGAYASGLSFYRQSRRMRLAYDMAMSSDLLTDKQKRELTRSIQYLLQEDIDLRVTSLLRLSPQVLHQLIKHIDQLLDD